MMRTTYDPDLSKRADEELHLTEKEYSLKDAAALLHVSVSTLHGYLHDIDLNLQEVWGPTGRKRYMTSEDIKYIWMLRHTFHYGHRPTRKKEMNPPSSQEPKQDQGPQLGVNMSKVFDWAS